MSNKIESIVILFGILFVLVGISIHLFQKSRKYKREANDEFNKSLESISTIKSKVKEDTISERPVKLRGTLDSSKDKRDQPKKKAKPQEFRDYITKEDAELVRRTSINEDNGFLTSMIVANATDSALLGTVVGGDPVGAIVGDILNDSNSSTDYSDSPSHDSSWDTTDSTSYSSSSDSWSSSDTSSFDSSSSDW